jgi:hypothetical protein
MNRFAYATAVASLVVLTAQAAFADTTSNTAQIAAPVVAAPAAAVAAAPTNASVSMPAPAQRPAARIPGTFPNASFQDGIDQLYVLMPALSGNG